MGRRSAEDVFREFSEQVCWFDECQQKNIGLGDYLLTPHAILQPCYYLEFWVDAHIAKRIGVIENRKPGLILYGENVPDEDIEKIWWNLPRIGVHHYWLGAKNSAKDIMLTANILDGAIPEIIARSISGR